MRLRDLHSKLTWMTIAVLIMNAVLFLFTDPNSVSAVVLAFAILLMTANVYLLMQGASHMLSLWGVHVLASTRLQRYVTVTALVVIALASVGELSLRDVAVLLPLAALVYLYRTYQQSQRSSL